DLDLDIFPLDIAKLAERLAKRPQGFWAPHAKNADAPYPLGLLRARRERPRHRAAKQCDELAAFHSMTSSARPSSARGKVMPSVFAVLRLITSSTFVACWTGKSAGFSPLRMRPAYTPACR